MHENSRQHERTLCNTRMGAVSINSLLRTVALIWAGAVLCALLWAGGILLLQPETPQLSILWLVLLSFPWAYLMVDVVPDSGAVWSMVFLTICGFVNAGLLFGLHKLARHSCSA